MGGKGLSDWSIASFERDGDVFPSSCPFEQVAVVLITKRHEDSTLCILKSNEVGPELHLMSFQHYRFGGIVCTQNDAVVGMHQGH